MEWDRRSGRFPAALANDALARPKIHGRFRQTLVQQENCIAEFGLDGNCPVHALQSPSAS